METEQKLNQHLAVVFEEILPAFTEAGIKYWVFGGVGVAGVAGKFLRENQDIDTYVLEEDFPKVEPILKRLVEKHGAWDAEGWDLRYSMMKNNGRPKFDIFIRKVERFSVFPVYKVADGVEFRILETVKLSDDALIQEPKTLEGFQFFSPPKEVISQLLRSLAEQVIKRYDPVRHPKKLDTGSKHMIDAQAIFTKEELDDLLTRYEEKVKATEDALQ